MNKIIITIVAALTLIGCGDSVETMLKQEIDKGYLSGREVEVISYTTTDKSTESLIDIDYYEDLVTEFKMNSDKSKKRGYTGAWKAYQRGFKKYSKSLDSLRAIAKKYPITKEYKVLIKIDDSITDTFYVYKR